MDTFKPLANAGTKSLFDLWADADGQTLFVCGDEGALLRSDDGGGSWSAIDTGFNGIFWAIAGNGPDDIFVTGHSKHGSVLLHSADGRRFKKVSVGRRAGLRALALWGDELYVAGGREVLRSRDHGESFEVVYAEYNSISDLLCVGPGRVFSAGYDTIMETRDAGTKWSRLNQPVGAHLLHVQGSLEHGLYAVGAWDVLTSKNGGESWQELIAHDRHRDFASVAVWAAGDVYVLGRSGDILHADGDKGFVEVRPSGGHLRRARVAGERVYAVGSGGTVLALHRGPRPAGAAIPPRASGSTTPRKGTRRGAKAPGAAVVSNPASDAKLRELIERAGDRSNLFLAVNEVSSLAALADVPEVESLSLWGAVPDLATMPVLPKLRQLSLHGKVKDLSPLAAQPALVDLALARTTTALPGLAALQKLTRLDLHECNAVKDLAPIAACASLSELVLPSEVPSLAPLDASKSLRTLSLIGSGAPLASLHLPLTKLTLKDVDDLGPAAAIPTLTELEASGTFSDLAPLAGLTALRRLLLSSSGLQSLAPLAKLTRLQCLTVQMPAGDLAPLAGLRELERLVINERVTDVAPLRELTSLRELWLGGNRGLQDLRPLSGLSALTTLQISHTAVRDLAPLAGLRNLEVLWAEVSRVESVAPLAGLPKLNEIHLAASSLASLAGIEDLPSLAHLNVSKTRVRDLLPLRGARSLTWLGIADLGAVRNDDALTALTALTALYADNTALDPRWLARLPKLARASGHAVSYDRDRAAEILGPGAVFGGRVGSAVLGAQSVADVAASPDGALVAVALHGGRAPILLFETDGGRSFDGPGAGAHRAEGVAFSVDGARLYYTTRPSEYGHELELWSAPCPPARGTPEKLGAVTRRYGGRLCTLADGKTLALVGDRVDLWDLARGEIVRTMMANVSNQSACAVAATGSPALYIWGLEPSEIARYDHAAEKVTAVWKAPYAQGQVLTIDRGERFLVAVGPNSYGVQVLDLRTEQRLLKDTFYADRHQTPAVVSADGTLLITVGRQLEGYRLPDGAAKAPGPSTGLAGYGTILAGVDVARDASLVACVAMNYREGHRLLWIPLVSSEERS